MLDGGRVILERTGATFTRFVYGLGEAPIYSVTSTGTKQHVHTDALGSVVATTADTGTVTARFGYGPFGENSLLAGVAYRFAGARLDAETGLYHMGARYYSTSIGRFLSPDPIGYGDGPNLYAYAHNSPLRFEDPTGLLAVPRYDADWGGRFGDPVQYPGTGPQPAAISGTGADRAYVGGYQEFAGGPGRVWDEYATYTQGGANAVFLEWWQEDAFIEWARVHGGTGVVMGNSWGAGMVARAIEGGVHVHGFIALDGASSVNLSALVDSNSSSSSNGAQPRLSRSRPDFAAIESNVDFFIVVNATGPLTRSTIIGNLGGEWGNEPEGIITHYYEAPTATHVGIRQMLNRACAGTQGQHCY